MKYRNIYFFLFPFQSAGVGLLSIPLLVAAGMSFLASSIALFGKLCAAASFTIVYVHSSEIFPTPIRNSGMGLVAVASR